MKQLVLLIQNRKAIQQSIDNLKGKMTIIIIIHRLSTIDNVDTVCLLSQGRIVDENFL